MRDAQRERELDKERRLEAELAADTKRFLVELPKTEAEAAQVHPGKLPHLDLPHDELVHVERRPAPDEGRPRPSNPRCPAVQRARLTRKLRRALHGKVDAARP